MKICALVQVVSVSVLLAAPGSVWAAEGSFERTLAVTGPVQLSIVAGSGDITVRAGAAGAVVVRGTVRESRGGRASADAEAAVRRVEQQPPIVQEGNQVKVGELSEEISRLVSVSYEVTVPAETDLRARSGSGDIAVRGIARESDLSSGSGDVEASGTTGAVRVSTGSGDVRVGAAATVSVSTGSGNIVATGVRGAATLKTGSGDVRLELADGPAGDVSVSAASGDVRISGVRAGLDASTASGDLTVEGAVGAAWSLSSASGDVSLTLPASAAFALDARTTSGRIETSLPVTVSGEIGRRELKGDVRGGGPTLKVRSASGHIVIRN